MRVFPDELLLRNPAARCCAALKVPDILYFPEDDAERQRAQATRAAEAIGKYPDSEIERLQTDPNEIFNRMDEHGIEYPVKFRRMIASHGDKGSDVLGAIIKGTRRYYETVIFPEAGGIPCRS